jgi:hypothetical protein
MLLRRKERRFFVGLELFSFIKPSLECAFILRLAPVFQGATLTSMSGG